MGRPKTTTRSAWDPLPLGKLKEWAAQQGATDFAEVFGWADLADPKTARASSLRALRGEAPVVRQKIQAALTAREELFSVSTPIGELVRGVAEWHQIGERLATISPDRFLKELTYARAAHDEVTGRTAAPRGSARAAARAKIDTPIRSDEAGEAAANKKKR